MIADTAGAPGAGPRAVDFHSHVLPQAYVARLAELAQSDPMLSAARHASTPEGMSRLPSSCARHMLNGLEGRLDLLSASGIACQILSAGSALAFPRGVAHRVELVSAWNDAVRDAILASPRPSAFRVFGSVPLPDVPAAIRETHRVAQHETTVGFSVTAHVLGESLDSERFHPLFSLWNEMDAAVFVHPDRFRTRGLMPTHTEVDAGTQFDDTLATLQVTGPGIRERFPRIRWIIAHLGGTFAFLLERLDEHWERDQQWRPGTRRPSTSLDNVWFDTAGHGPAAVRFAIETLGHERFVFGTDFPMLGAKHLEGAVERLHYAVSGLDRANKILGGTVRELLPQPLGGPVDRRHRTIGGANDV
ncbi:5-carboxyvanillate decarboxylase [Streptosporangium violaceochromogenes]|nr:5-carboxyvanillate decarboxylase [Streptosporangium violaceochromogenes]